jgi:aspartyl-tRNA(Asn)/glutamyl-tRNA(Gln) amidotransferase subunit C
MTVSKKTIKHVANLAKLEVDENSSETFSNQVSDILEYINVLQEPDTQNVQPTNQVTGLKNIFREDVVKDYPEDKKAKLFREAPDERDGYIVVPHSITKLT